MSQSFSSSQEVCSWTPTGEPGANTADQSPHTSIFICTFFNIVFAETGPRGGMIRKSSLKYWTSQRITQNIQYWYSEEDSGKIQNKEGKRATEREKERDGESGTVGCFISEIEKNKEMKQGEALMLLWYNMSPNRHFGTAEAGNKPLNWIGLSES